MEMNESLSNIVPSQSRANSFHSIFREQQLQVKRLQDQLSAVRQHNKELSGENTQLKLAIAAGAQGHHLHPLSKQQRYSSARLPTEIQFAPGIASYEKHIQTLERDKQCAHVELDTATRHVSDLRETVNMLERQIDKIHREYRSKLIGLTTQLYPAQPNPAQPNAADELERQIRASYGQQLIDLRERCRVYRAQTFNLRTTEKELRARQALLEHTTHSCIFQESCIETCLSVVKHIEASVDNGHTGVALAQACALLRHTLAKFLPQIFQKYNRKSDTGPGRECHQWELMELYDHLIGEIQTYKRM